GEQLGIMASVSALAWAIMQMPIGRYIDGSKIKGMMVVSEAIGVPLMFVWLTQSRFEAFAAGQVLFAATAATWTPTISTYLTRQISAAERGEAFGRLYMFRGIVAFPAPAIGGILYAWGGMQAPILANLIGIIAVIGVLIWFVPEPQGGALDSEPLDRTVVAIRRD
ncbi:MAG: MFS transporter, partial [Chloroflexi bacterium]|nr:MFS transporter [Chloroflexota bacterium]